MIIDELPEEAIEYIKATHMRKTNNQVSAELKELFGVDIIPSTLSKVKIRMGMKNNGKITNCFICGKEFFSRDINVKHTKNYCSDACRREGSIRNHKSHKSTKKTKEVRKIDELSMVAQRAREAGMTYGKYVAIKWQRGEKP